MKKWMIPCALILSFGLWKSVAFRQHWEDHFLQVKQAAITQRAHERALAFMRNHQKEATLLLQKGWRKPTRRLKVIKFLDSLAPGFQSFTYTCAPAETSDRGGHTFRVTRIVIETTSSHDAPVYDLLQTLPQKFPGIIVVRQVRLQRKEFSLIHSQLHLDWVSLP